METGITNDGMLSDEQLMLLEQVTYIDDWFDSEYGTFRIRNVADMMADFDEEKLKELDAMKEESPGGKLTATGAEWAAIIRAIQQDDELMKLELQESNTDAEMYCFIYPDKKEEAVVVFRGTVDGDEWYDNVKGLNTADTECQVEALDFVESLPYDNITVVGHSKGANKAQYVTILSDKVNRCVAMDGQGFSQKFLDKYYVEISEKGKLITNHSLANDYVHILMFPVPGATQVYYKGMEENYGFPQNHYSGYFFVFKENTDGTLGLELSEVVEREAQCMTYLRELTYFIINVMPEEKKPGAVDFIGTVLALAMNKDATFTIEYNGVEYKDGELTKMVIGDVDSLATVLAYILKYMDTYGVESNDIRNIIREFGGEELLDKALVVITALGNPVIIPVTALADPLAWILEYLISEATDDEIDYKIPIILNALIEIFSKSDMEFDVCELWSKVQSEYQQIGEVDAQTANVCGMTRKNYTKDFSRNAYELLMEAINSSESIRYYGTSGWGNYACESWYSSLPVERVRNNVNLYFNKLSEIQTICKQKINIIFDEVACINQSNANRILDVRKSLHSFSVSLASIANDIG